MSNNIHFIITNILINNNDRQRRPVGAGVGAAAEAVPNVYTLQNVSCYITCFVWLSTLELVGILKFRAYIIQYFTIYMILICRLLHIGHISYMVNLVT